MDIESPRINLLQIYHNLLYQNEINWDTNIVILGHTDIGGMIKFVYKICAVSRYIIILKYILLTPKSKRYYGTFVLHINNQKLIFKLIVRTHAQNLYSK